MAKYEIPANEQLQKNESIRHLLMKEHIRVMPCIQLAVKHTKFLLVGTARMISISSFNCVKGFLRT